MDTRLSCECISRIKPAYLQPVTSIDIADVFHGISEDDAKVRFLSVEQPHSPISKLVDSTFDVCFTMQFDVPAALDRYGKNPAHQKAAGEAFLPLSQRILFYDFITE